ncbi:Uncharacterised protein [Vibrio cholerae]|nr:Uncharacterised protein [Vibrio cholerae]CSB08377.1 Uncharacterised protein [Vibrio cholerae]CSB79436.1 Uncharacterised protein [Vibrio cholerae]CSC08576.1 Uncharacterised protein [Vibrio cholerae]CSD04101.1 Uncharacterised protein [Vibrio cholerae]
MLRSLLLSSCKPAYKVVDLPEPVGPVTRMIPCGRLIKRRKLSWLCAVIPKLCRSRRVAFLSSKRITTRSPCDEGMVETRTSTARPPIRSEIRPSCGTRFSAMSSLAITLTRETSSDESLRLGASTSRSTPSTRKRIDSVFSKVSM